MQSTPPVEGGQSRGVTWLAVVLQLLDLLLDEVVECAGLALGALALVCAPLPDWRMGGLCSEQAAGQRPASKIDSVSLVKSSGRPYTTTAHMTTCAHMAR